MSAAPKMSLAEREKIGAEIQRRVKAAAILTLAFNRKQDDSKHRITNSITIVFNMKSKSMYSPNWFSMKGDMKAKPGSGAWYLYPERAPNTELVVESTKKQFPKTNYVKSSNFEFTATSATSEEVDWARAVFEELGVTEETGAYRIEFETTVVVQRQVYIGKALNQGHAQMLALQQCSNNRTGGWVPKKDIDINSATMVAIRKVD